MKQAYDSFAEFYPFYLSQHRNRTCRRLHVVGLALGLSTGLVALTSRIWALLPVTLLIGYAFGWIGHFFFEKNRPATFGHPLYSFLGDFTMAKDIVTGKMPF
jgi:hypothetical protein